MNVKTYILKPNGNVFQTRLDGDYPPKGSIRIATNGIDTISVPMTDPHHERKIDNAVEKLSNGSLL